jgi:hypothetical protein
VSIPAIPVIASRIVSEAEPEHREMSKYEPGEADADERAASGTHDEPWLNVPDEREFGSPPRTFPATSGGGPSIWARACAG